MSATLGRLFTRLPVRLIPARVNATRTLATARKATSASPATPAKPVRVAAKPVSTTTAKPAAAAAPTKRATKSETKPAPTTVKKAAKKPAAKKPVKKVLTAEQRQAALERAKERRDVAKRQALRKEALILPPRPVRLSGYNVYMGESMKNRPQDTKAEDWFRSMATGKAWKDLSEAEQEKYNKIAKERVTRVKKEWDDYINSLTSEQIKAANKARRALAKFGVKGEIAQVIKDPHAPKRPSTAYIFFFKENINKFTGEKAVVRTQALAAAWKALPEEEKKPYIERANADSARYSAEASKA